MLSKIFNPTKLAVILLSLTLLYLDQFSKSYVMKNLDFFIEGYRVFPFLNFVFVTNKGISFGLLSEFNISFYLGVLSILISALITAWILKSNKKSEIISLGFILGGALGNGIDRINNNYVIDFIDLHIFGYHWPSFNLADTFITIGAIIFLYFNLNFFRFRKK